MKKIIRVATHSGSLGTLLQGQLHFMSAYYEMIGIGSSGDVTDGEAVIDTLGKKENVRVIPVEMTREITPLKDLKALFQLYKIFKKEKPAIVHSHTPKAGTLAMLAAKIARVPNRLHTVAGLPLVEATGARRRLLNFVEKITYACATKVYPNSFGLREIILNNKFTDPQKIKVIGTGSSNGIDTSHFTPSFYSEADKHKLRKQLTISPSDFVYTFLGRIVKDKGINELVKAFKNIQKEHTNAKLLLVGYYDQETAQLLLETENEIETNKSIILIGWQEDVRPFLAISNVLAFPSYREGFPNTVLQASAMQIPSIVSDINGCNEIVEEGINGTIIPVKNVQALQKSMEELLINKKYYTYLAQNARAPICEKYERKRIWKSLLEEYESL
ncbi:glycosyltransferase family 4 protein [uncultured Dokdonia sp.]|uniref:glycosyltransferase family 4 protein n=1 Tax=uncultured Dokdonia sp. TaxID=575653 RepID=UPI002628C832|nr:glycosyltransferase family 4 protein [uncultured Dokdonia sp.]